MKSIIKKFIGIRENESFNDGLERKRIQFLKLFNKNKFNIADLKCAFENLGIEHGDKLMVHCAYRQFYNYSDTPKDIIDTLLKLVGEEGAIFMPSFPKDIYYLDINNSISCAGVLSEYFRKNYNVERSFCASGNIIGKGKDVSEILGDSQNCVYSFDQHSAYYKFAQFDNSKILMLGLGKIPVKNTVFHCVGYQLKDKLDCFRNLYDSFYEQVLIDELGNKRILNLTTRNSNCRNSNWNMKRVFHMIPQDKKAHIKISNLDTVLYSAKAGFETAFFAANKDITIYNRKIFD